MIHLTNNERLNLAAAALARISSPLDQPGRAAWRLTPGASGRCNASATLEDNWLVLAARDELGLLSNRTPWNLLERNAKCAGLGKLALAPGGTVQLRAELPLTDDTDLSARVCETCDDFEFLGAPYAFADHEARLFRPPAKLDLKQLCTESGWPFVERGAEKLLIELETPAGFRQASLMASGGGIWAGCELANCDALAPESREAIAVLLLGLSGVVRLARGSATAGIARLEVAFATLPSGSEFSSALESLSVGCSSCGEEIKALLDPAIARQFLALRHGNPVAVA